MKTAKLLYCGILIFILVNSSCSHPKESTQKSDSLGFQHLFVEDGNYPPFFSKKEGVFAKNGMVSTAHPLATEVGLQILKNGGNAVDAAIATHFALAVVFPFAGNLGGGGFALVRSAEGKTFSLDFREKAPLAAAKNMFLDDNEEVIPDISLLGHLASGVPGSVSGMGAMHKKFGVLPWADLIEPSIKLAENGFLLLDNDAKGLNRYNPFFTKINGEANNCFRHPSGKEWTAGERLVQPLLAKTLKRIAINGAQEFYQGETADLIVSEFAQKGIITQEDLANYVSLWREPIEGNYRGLKVFSMPPPSSGGVALMQLLLSVEPYDFAQMGYQNDSVLQLFTEAMRRVYADRSRWLGDTDFNDLPIDSLLRKSYVNNRMKHFNFDEATASKLVQPGKIKGYEKFETTHFSIVDKDRMAVSLTTTLNGAYGSKVIVKGAGFLMNNEMDDFSIKPGEPNMFGLVGSVANEISPEKRMLSSMTPTIVEKDNELFLVLGTPGGSTIITSVFQTLVNVVDFNMGMQQAVNALKIHHQWLPDKIFYEAGRVDSLQKVRLSKKGYVFNENPTSLGRMDCIMVHPNGILEGGSDPRALNTSLGY
jgi:gamma-glutamyltranspeptidase/glutathione hydrolase